MAMRPPSSSLGSEAELYMSRHRFATSSGKPPILAFIDMIVHGASSCSVSVSSLMYSGA